MPRNNKSSSKPQRCKPQSRGGAGRPDARPRHAGGSGRRQRHLSVRSELKARPDIRRIARAVIELAMAQAELEAAQSCGGAAATESVPAAISNTVSATTANGQEVLS